MRDDVVAELGTFDLCSTFHLAGEIISHAFGTDRAIQTFDDEISGFRPAEVTQHHFAGENHGTRIYFIQIRIFWRGAVRCFKNRVAGDVIDISAGGDADAADLRGQCVGQIIAIEIQRRDDVEIFRDA